MHIEKCAGTTFRAMLEPLFHPSLICPERGDGLGNWTINELAQHHLFAGHFDLAVCRCIPGDVRVFTMLREPKSRLLSLYRFWRSHVPDPERDRHPLMQPARELDAEAFFAHPLVVGHPGIRDAIVGQLIRTGLKHSVEAGHPLLSNPEGALARAWDRLQALAAFGIMERFEDSRALLNDTLGLTMQPTAPRQVLAQPAESEPDFEPVPEPPITSRLDGLLEALTTIDRPLYARALNVFERRRAPKGTIASRLVRFGRRRRQPAA